MGRAGAGQDAGAGLCSARCGVGAVHGAGRGLAGCSVGVGLSSLRGGQAQSSGVGRTEQPRPGAAVPARCCGSPACIPEQASLDRLFFVPLARRLYVEGIPLSVRVRDSSCPVSKFLSGVELMAVPAAWCSL